MTTEKQAAKKDLQKRIDRIDGSRNTWLGFRNLKKDAIVIKSDLEDLLEQVEGDNEEICNLRLNVIVFAGRSKGAKETRQQLEILDDRCDAVVSVDPKEDRGGRNYEKMRSATSDLSANACR